MMEIQKKAALGYAEVAQTYERGRPEYPAEALDALISLGNLGPSTCVVDLGAGTGRFTKLLTSCNAHLIAVEPVAGMRQKFTTQLPTIEILEGTAERIPLGDQVADVIVCAQAFHWFNGTVALPEIFRVLKLKGKLILIWNVRDLSDPLQAALSDIMNPHEDGAPRYQTMRWKAPFEHTTLFSPLEQLAFPTMQTGDVNMVVDRVASVSFIAALPDATKKDVIEQTRQAALRCKKTTGDENISLPYLTTIFWCERR